MIRCPICRELWPRCWHDWNDVIAHRKRIREKKQREELKRHSDAIMEKIRRLS